MSSEKRDPEQRLWRWFLMLHAIIFAGVWAGGLYELVAYPYLISKFFAPVALLWVPFFLLHMAAYSFYAGRRGSAEKERQAYREGVADALRQLRATMPERAQRLSIQEEEELFNAAEPEKRKRL